ncbi:MAG: peptidoglycan DD-metalloendopeptidase family protein [Bacillota bacterium]
MAKRRNTFSGLTSKWSTKVKPVMKNAIVAALTVSALTFGTGNTMAAPNLQLSTFFHVYIQDEFVGTVADKKEVESLIQNKLTSMEETYKDIDLEVGSEITYIPEQAFQFNSSTQAEDVLNQVESKLDIKANVSALVIDGEEVAFVKDEAAAENVIDSLMLDHVSEEELAQLEKRQTVPNQPLPQLKENQTRLLDVKLSKEVSFIETKVNPDEVLAVEDVVTLFKKGTLEEKKYEVKSGDVLGAIADSHDLTLKQLLSLNADLNEDTLLKPGMELKVTYQQPLAIVEVNKEVYTTEEVPFEKKIVEDSSMAKGETKVKQEGSNGLNGVTYSVTEQNGQVVKKETLNTTVLKEAVEEIIIKGTKVIPSRGTGSFAWPTNGGYVSSNMGYRWGSMHKGMDIARPSERTIKSVDNGVVVSTGNRGDGYGNKVIIDHQNGYRTLYAHLESISVQPGQTVSRGGKIGVMGSTGNSTGVHLHIEVTKNGKLVDPRTVLGNR